MVTNDMLGLSIPTYVISPVSSLIEMKESIFGSVDDISKESTLPPKTMGVFCVISSGLETIYIDISNYYKNK